MTDDQQSFDEHDVEQDNPNPFRFPEPKSPQGFKKTAHMKRFVIFTVFLAIIGVGAVLGAVFYFRAPLPQAPPTTDAPLSSISLNTRNQTQTLLTRDYQEGDARFNKLADFFRDANPTLFTRIQSLVTQHATGANSRGATYIAGVGGVGKSYVIGKLGLPEGATSEKIKLAEVFEGRLADLQTVDGERVLNRLPWTEDFSIEKLLADHNATGKAFVLVDELDEIHEDIAVKVLRGIEEYVGQEGAAGDDGFVHFIVMGRPEAFWPWVSDAERVTPVGVTDRPMVLVGPEYQTVGDLAFRCRDYLGWKYDGTSAEDVEKVVAGFVARMQAHDFLRETVRPLFGGNVVIDEVYASVVNGTPMAADAQAIRVGMLRRMIERNADSHGRPSWDDAVYLGLLKQAAAFAKSSENAGWFEVGGGDAVEFVDAAGVTHKVRLSDLLSRSGIVFLDAGAKGDNGVSRYRFEPSWVEEALVEGAD